ncbi:hypothetical protein B566_EDAN002954 [Ephemera danica]|nr:hypothetical protein B566_EDAN002954 [Ephemera danica]
MVAAVAWLFMFLTVVEAQVFLPWENFQVPNDPNDEDDRKVSFDCYANCFGLTPSETFKKPLAKVQPHCYKKGNSRKSYCTKPKYNLGFSSNNQTLMNTLACMTSDRHDRLQTGRHQDLHLWREANSNYLGISWLAAYARCRKNSLDLLGQGLATWDEEFANKILKYFSDGDAFWLGGTNMADNRLRWSDTGNDIAPTGRAAKITQSGSGPQCLEARVSGSALTWGTTPCTEAKSFVCVLQKPCMAA